MSLEGSIKEFGLAEILQLISMQKKSGVVSISHENESTSLYFDNGQLVFATSIFGGETKRLGEILVNSGKLTERNVENTLRMQEVSKDKIGKLFVSSGLISTDDVKDALQQQLMDVIFHVLRWRDGHYKFNACEIDYDREFQIPVQTDFILMEGSRMVDEWGYIESKIPAANVIFSQTDKGSEVEQLFSKLSPDELSIYNLVDGNRDISDILTVSQLGKFPVFRIMLTLMMSGFITPSSLSNKQINSGSGQGNTEPVETSAEVHKEKAEYRIRLKYAFQMAILIFVISFILLLLPAGEMVGLGKVQEISDTLRQYRTAANLNRLKRAISYYYLVNGNIPDSLSTLYSDKYVGDSIISDEWHNQFVYEKYPDDNSSSDYRLYSRGKDNAALTPDDIY
ncbi:MAG: DUF4388 domain-containing protein [Nitrospirae bacterium]|nr:DUF4388 domain-containing protein [Nitrospirota bacterium]